RFTSDTHFAILNNCLAIHNQRWLAHDAVIVDVAIDRAAHIGIHAKANMHAAEWKTILTHIAHKAGFRVGANRQLTDDAGIAITIGIEPATEGVSFPPTANVDDLAFFQ